MLSEALSNGALPDFAFAYCLKYLPGKDIATCRRVCREWRSLIYDNVRVIAPLRFYPYAAILFPGLQAITWRSSSKLRQPYTTIYRPRPAGNDNIALLACLKDLRSATLDCCSLGCQDFQHLVWMKGLQELVLHECPFGTVASFHHISQCTQLTRLELEGQGFNLREASLTFLATLTRLRALRLHTRACRETCLSPISSLTGLLSLGLTISTGLAVSKVALSGAASMTFLVHLGTLERLELAGVAEVPKEVQQLTCLRYLHLEQVHRVTPLCIARIGSLHHLEGLTLLALRYENATPALLHPWSTLVKLRHLVVGNSSIDFIGNDNAAVGGDLPSDCLMELEALRQLTHLHIKVLDLRSHSVVHLQNHTNLIRLRIEYQLVDGCPLGHLPAASADHLMSFLHHVRSWPTLRRLEMTPLCWRVWGSRLEEVIECLSYTRPEELFISLDPRAGPTGPPGPRDILDYSSLICTLSHISCLRSLALGLEGCRSLSLSSLDLGPLARLPNLKALALVGDPALPSRFLSSLSHLHQLSYLALHDWVTLPWAAVAAVKGLIALELHHLVSPPPQPFFQLLAQHSPYLQYLSLNHCPLAAPSRNERFPEQTHLSPPTTWEWTEGQGASMSTAWQVPVSVAGALSGSAQADSSTLRSPISFTQEEHSVRDGGRTTRDGRFVSDVGEGPIRSSSSGDLGTPGLYITPLQHLRYLSVQHCTLPPFHTFLAVLKSLPDLRHLNLLKTSLEIRQASSIIDALGQLQYLNMEQYPLYMYDHQTSIGCIIVHTERFDRIMYSELQDSGVLGTWEGVRNTHV